jgi:drug/metabolite transporter (DMT)-like permease
MLFSYGIVGFFATIIILTVESLINWTPWRFTSYTGEQYGWMLLASFVSNCSIVFNIIAA